MMESHQEREPIYLVELLVARFRLMRPFVPFYSISFLLCVCVCGMENWNGYVHDPHELSIPTITFSTHLQEFGWVNSMGDAIH